MNILIWTVFGGIAGWVASMIIDPEMSIGILGNVAVGIAGAFIGGKLASIWFGEERKKKDVQETTSLVNFLWALATTCLLLLLTNLIF